MRWFLVVCAVGVMLLGWVGSEGLAGPERAGYLGGAATLAGSLLICFGFTFQLRWLGIGGAAVIGLLGSARNVVALWDLAHAGMNGPDLFRVAIAGVCLAVVIACGRTLMRERGNLGCGEGRGGSR